MYTVVSLGMSKAGVDLICMPDFEDFNSKKIRKTMYPFAFTIKFRITLCCFNPNDVHRGLCLQYHKIGKGVNSEKPLQALLRTNI